MSTSTVPVPSDTTLSRPRRWAALAVLTASLLVITMDMTILNIALPQMAGELHPTAQQQLWIIDVYSLVLAGLLVSSAAIADRWGRRRMLLLGYSIFAVASILVLFADSAAMVIGIRALLGVGGAMIMPTTLSLIRVIFTSPRERATALSIWAAVSGLGAAVGPLVGGVLLEHFSWHAAFLVNVPLMVIGIVAGLFFLPESRVANPGRWDAVAAVLSLVGMVALVWGIKEFGKEASFAVPAAWAAVAVAAAAMSWFVVRCLRRDDPLLELRLFRSRPFSAGIIAALGATFSMIAAMLLIAQWLQLVNGSSPVEAGVSLIPVAIAGAIASLLAPPLARLIGARTVLAGGLALAAAGMIWIGVAGAGLTFGSVLVALTLVGAGTGSLAIGSAMIMSSTPEEKAGNAGALEETSYELGGTLGVAVLGSIAALVYRAELQADAVLDALDPALAEQATESLGAAVAIADGVGSTELAARAGEAFTASLQIAGYAGGALMLAVAVLVFVLTPRGTNVTGGH
ncbi:MFS transporter [Microbacterium sp. No. 7]|uniref:MFS transporter n=1 Tax=Microbacterium sp. No. 7 TaxID=1714373 RepID=UPI0006D19383|nr:MFS transporter [Microbacterium sp. No. 7]ALJ18699.1 MFS transporter [Microbacterium sp. No. 7]